MPKTYVWTGASSTNVGAAANWFDLTDGINPSPTVPGITDTDLFQIGTGGTISGSGTAAVFSFFNGGTWRLATGTNLTAQSSFQIGNGVSGTAGIGNVVIGSGSTIASAGFILVGQQAGSSGTLTVSGGGVLRGTAPGDPSIYAMQIGTNGAAGTLAAASGVVFVTGPGSLIDLGNNALTLGNAGGNGSLTISNGGSVISASPGSTQNSLSIGRLGNGTVTVTGAGSQLTAKSGFAYIARAATGTLTVENGGHFVATVDGLGSGGLLIGQGSATALGGSALASVSTSGVLTSEGVINVGTNGNTGELDVLNAGTVEVGTSLTVGSIGTISGLPGTFAGKGTVSIGSGGTVMLTGTVPASNYGVIVGTSNVGPSVGGDGTVIVSGTEALLSSNGNALAVGLMSSGKLSIANGGTVTVGSPDFAQTAALSVGRLGTGTIVVGDPGSSLQAAGGAGVGGAGSGVIQIINKGSVHVGLDSHAAGAFLVGAGSNGGTTVNSILLGGTGSVEVTGGTLYSEGLIGIGQSGVGGLLSIKNAGLVETERQLRIGGSVTLAAGGSKITTGGTSTVKDATVISSAGVVTVSSNSTLVIDDKTPIAGAPGLVLGSAFGAVGSLSSTTASSVSVAGNAELWGGSTLEVDATSNMFLGSASVAVLGAVAVEAGHSFSLSNGGGVIDASVANNGTVNVSANGGSAFKVTGSLGGSGTLNFLSASTLELGQSVGGTQTFNLYHSGLGPASDGDTLILDSPGIGFSSILNNFAAGDRIEFGGGLKISAAKISGPTTITLTTSAGSYALSKVSFFPGPLPQLAFGFNSNTGNAFVEAAAGTLTYVAGPGPDTFIGGSENDVINVSAAAVSGDTFTGGGGTNTLTLTTAGTFSLAGVKQFTPINLAAGSNTVTVTDNTLSGGTVTIKAGSSTGNKIDASAATASSGKTLTYVAGPGPDTFIGGSENDTVSVSLAALAGDTLTAGSGTNTLTLSTAGAVTYGANVKNFTTLKLAAGNNTVTVTDAMLAAGKLTIRAGASGNNNVSATGDTAASKGKTLTYIAAKGVDTFTGGFENDTVSVSLAALAGDTLTAGSGTNTLTLSTAGAVTYGANVKNFTTLNLAAGNNTVTVTDAMLAAGKLTIRAGASGNNNVSATGDTAASKGKTLTYIAAKGIDTFTGGFENDTINVTAAAVSGDAFTGGGGTNTLTLSSAGTFSLAGVKQFSPINLAKGSNTVTVTDNTLSGGSVTIKAGSSTGNKIDASSAVASSGKTLIYSAGAGPDTFIGGSENDIVTGGIGNDTLTGGDGNDTLNGGAGNDILNGGAGNDALNGGADADTMAGGLGNDTYQVDNIGDALTENAGEGTDTVRTTLSSYTLGLNLENLTFIGSGNFTGTGNTLANVITGGAGDDVLEGSTGADALHGGAGADKFIYRTLSDSTVGAAGRDTIADFSSLSGDKIDLHLLEALTGVTFNFIGTIPFSGLAGELRYAPSGANTIVSGDVNGDKAGDFSILLSGTHVLSASDFVL